MGRGCGIDYGGHSFKLAEVRTSGDKVILRRAARIPLGPTADGTELAAALTEKGIRLRNGTFGVSGRDSILRYTHVPPVPPWRMKLIMDYEISEIASKGGGNITADYRMLNVPRDVSQDLTILVGMAKDDQVMAQIRRLEDGGVRIGGACPTSLALFNAHHRLGEEGEEATLLVHLGHEHLDIVISQGGHLVFARSAQLGGKDFDEAIASSLGISPEEAQRLKEERGAVQREGWETPRDRRISDALMGVVANLLSVIQSSVKFCRAQTKIKDLKIERVLLSGGGARLRGLPEHLQDALKMPVSLFDPVSRVDMSGLAPEVQEEVRAGSVEMAVPIGLALVEADPDSFQLDLLPSPMKARREFRTRTAYLYVAGIAAGLALFLNLVWAIGGMWREGGRNEQLLAMKEEVDGRHRDWVSLRNANDVGRQEMETLVAETRPAWAYSHLLHVLGEMTPRQVAIAEVTLERGGEKRVAGAPVKLEVRGYVDNATGSAFEILDGFKKTLDGVREFASASIDTTRTQHDDKAGVLKFVIVVDPEGGS